MKSSSSHSSNWFVCPPANSEAESRLFLFPYAGAGPAVFNQWSSRFPGNLETWIVHYPGRGSRHTEPPINQVDLLAERLSEAIQPFLDKPFAFFGHSLGGMIAFELTRHLRRKNLPQPEILFLSACGAPHIPDPNPPLHTLPDDRFLQSLGQLHGVPAELSHQPDVLQLLLPILRADFEAVENYVYRPELPLRCPIAAFGGLDDPRLSRERLEAWCLQTASSFKSQYFPCDHFFIHTAREAVIAAIVTG
jgi:medium-chain acyl-[acyl-carrier-protein] hydrolase